jgi:hypothetical protein
MIKNIFEILDIFGLGNLLAIFGNIFHRKNRKKIATQIEKLS